MKNDDKKDTDGYLCFFWLVVATWIPCMLMVVGIPLAEYIEHPHSTDVVAEAKHYVYISGGLFLFGGVLLLSVRVTVWICEAVRAIANRIAARIRGE